MNEVPGAGGALFILALLIVVIAVLLATRGRPKGPKRRRGGVGTAAVGSVYGFLNEDKQRAVDIIVEEKAGERRPEYPDGNLPDLDEPTRKD